MARTAPLDADSDDDLPDVEDANRNGLVDPGEKSPYLADSDGFERGLQTAAPDPDGAGPAVDTDPAAFEPSADPAKTSDPLDAGSTPFRCRCPPSAPSPGRCWRSLWARPVRSPAGAAADEAAAPTERAPPDFRLFPRLLAP